ncbi:MAG: class I SAM-dependent methyltransferase [Vicinamibacterales bacterium]
MNVDHRFTQTQKQYAADDLETMSEAKRYQAHVFELLRPHIGSSVLEVGCGIGTTSLRLAEIAERLVCIEPNLNCVSRARAALDGNPRITLRICHLEECDRGELIQQRFDTIVCVNVLEHIEDDIRALSLFRELVAPTGGRVLIFVPAVQAAYGPLDAALGHHRRYSKRTLHAAFADAGMDLMALRYTNPIGLLGWMYNARISGATEHTSRQVRLFEQFVAPWALPLDRLAPPPIGLSLFAVGRARLHAA